MAGPSYDFEDVEKHVGPSAFWEGQEYFEDGRVVDLDAEANGKTLLGQVKGEQRKPYQLKIELEKAAGAPTKITGHCSCSVGYNCKHVAAVLIEAIGRWDDIVEPEVESDEALGISLDTELWLQEIDRSLEDLPSDDYPEDERQRLVFALSPPVGGEERAQIHLFTVKLKPDGSYGSTATPFAIDQILEDRPAGFLRPRDIEILREAFWICGRDRHQLILPINLDGAALLKAMLESERCHWQDAHGAQLSLASARKGEAHWAHSEFGRQRLEVSAHDADAVIPSSPPYYVDSSMGACGPVKLGLDDRVAGSLMLAPEVRAEDAKALSDELTKRLGAKSSMPLPKAPSDTEVRMIKPTPHLRLYARTMELDLPYFFQTRRRDWRPVGGEYSVPLGRLIFDYGSETISHHDQRTAIEMLEGDVLVRLERDFEFEQAALQKLIDQGLTELGDAVHMRASSEFKHEMVIAPKLEQIERGVWVDDARWIGFLDKDVPTLREDGWTIEFDGSFPLSITAPPDGWWAGLDETSEMDWFEFVLGIDVEGERIDLLPKIEALLAEIPGNLSHEDAYAALEKKHAGTTIYHRLKQGRVIPIEADRLLPVMKAMLSVFGSRRDEDETFKLHVAQSTAVEEFMEATEELGLEVENAERFIRLGENIAALGSLTESAPPASFKGELRPYQATGLSWLQHLRSVEFGGVLADDMGLGKTVQTLAHLCAVKAYGQADGPVLLVAPTSLIPNWKHETARFAPHFKVLILHGPDRKKLFAEIPNYDLVLTTYPLLARDQDHILKHRWDTVILDEAQAIKNPKATVTQVSHKLDAGHRIALTGTPLENNLSELWSIFRFLIPGLLNDSAAFRRRFRTPIEKHGDDDRQRQLIRRIRPFLLRRTKDEVAKDLPPKSEIIEYVALEGSQRDLYETIRLSMHDRVKEAISERGLAGSRITILDSLLKLRQICCDPRLTKLEDAKSIKESAKLERLMELLPQLLAEGRRILLFSQFTSMLDLIKEELDERTIDYVTLTGQTKDRETPVKRFQDKEVPLFLISLKAGGVGLNLTAADVVIHYDPWWNPAVENQATDRAHRIGQENPVFVFKLIVKDAVEEAIQQLKGRKQQLADSLFDDDFDDDMDLSDNDLNSLFGVDLLEDAPVIEQGASSRD